MPVEEPGVEAGKQIRTEIEPPTMDRVEAEKAEASPKVPGIRGLAGSGGSAHHDPPRHRKRSKRRKRIGRVQRIAIVIDETECRGPPGPDDMSPGPRHGKAVISREIPFGPRGARQPNVSNVLPLRHLLDVAGDL